MRSRKSLVALLALTGVAAMAAVPAQAGTAKQPKKTVTVNDNYYGPSKLTVKSGTKVTWDWTYDTTDIHDVKLVSAPKGVKQFQSGAAAAGYEYSKALTKPGVYKFICTFHVSDGMKMTITVRK
ncbi:MAG TPA: plastocyanin/azurin family copper-binding protein [Solirubrobacteraceae bacterium]|nr:plastocyanin/azurin family copper-binding protein [Solirubrobacteraceae bacterium]